nr:MAG TPA: hypothetical protein [Caudoviricetes sp.]
MYKLTAHFHHPCVLFINTQGVHTIISNNHTNHTIKYVTMDMYEVLLQRVITLTNEYLKLKERMSEMEKELNTKHLSSPRIIKMKIEKSK